MKINKYGDPTEKKVSARRDSVVNYNNYLDKLNWLIENGFDQRPDDGLRSRTSLERSSANSKNPLSHNFVFPNVPTKKVGSDQAPSSTTIWEKESGPNERENVVLSEYDKPSENKMLSELKAIDPKTLKRKRTTPELNSMRPVKKPSGRAALQVGRLAQGKKESRYGHVLDREYYWDDKLKKWQNRKVDEERKGQPIIKANF